ncbi:MAG: outer membrane protein assembly factor BamA, partial [Spirochaetaceae bacterium]
MNKLLWSIIFCTLAVTTLQAQDATAWFLNKPIVGFEFVGAQAHSTQELSAILAGYKDKPFTYDLYWEMQNRLYALEYFESVQADAVASDDTKTSVVIRFTVKERATVLKIQYQGNDNISEKDLNDSVLSKVGNIFNEPLIRKDADAIISLYKSKGFLDTSVNFEAVKNAENNSVTIVFKVTEGPKSTVKKVQFSGNSFASEGTLKGLMQTREPALFVSGDFIESKLQEDIAAIQAYYSEHGYVYALVEKVDRQIEMNEEEKRKYILLTFYIKEGTQYIFGGVTFSGNKVFSTEQLAAYFRQKSGDIFNSKKFKEDSMNMNNLYYDNGYITTQIKPEEKVDEGKRQLAIVINILEGDRSHIGRIIIQGNSKTAESVIRRELPFEEGDVFSKAKVMRGFMNLIRTGFFSQQSLIEPQPGSAEGLIDILITLEEQSTAEFEVGGTIIPGDFPFSAYANVKDNNFLGTGVTTGINLSVMPTQQSLSLYYQDNWLFGKRLTGGVSISFSHDVVQYVPQDILGPVFNGDEDWAAPDPYN